MIKVRFNTFETNSSSAHTVSWSKNRTENDIETETKFTNIIDMCECQHKTTFETFKEKISFLYCFEDSYIFYDFLKVFRKEYESENPNSDLIYLDDAYANDLHTKKCGSFRKYYKGTKKPLLKIIKELTNKEVEFENEDKFDYYSHDSWGWIPEDNEKKYIKEILLNPNLILECGNDYEIDSENAITDSSIVDTLIKKRRKMEKDEQMWFDWFKIEKESNG